MHLNLTRTMIAGAVVATGVLVLAGFAGGYEPASETTAPIPMAVAFKGGDGQEMGTATLVQTQLGLLIKLALDNVPAGVHGVRVGDRAVREAFADDQRLATVHAGADGRIRADLLTTEIRLDDGVGHLPGSPLFIGLRPVDSALTTEPEPAIACATMDA